MNTDTNFKSYALAERVPKARDIATLRFAPEDGTVPRFTPGQFISVRLGTTEKPYTITSTPDDPFLAITVKKIGAFSTALHELPLGGRVEMGEPYGRFLLDEGGAPTAFIAGGIGVAPFYAMLKGLPREHLRERDITLFYSVKTLADAAFLDFFAELVHKLPNFRLVATITQESIANPRIGEHGRFTLDTFKKYLPAFDRTQFYICGSIDFTDDFWQLLGDAGVSEERMFTEAFY